jgi:hypothetical protein
MKTRVYENKNGLLYQDLRRKVYYSTLKGFLFYGFHLKGLLFYA